MQVMIAEIRDVHMRIKCKMREDGDRAVARGLAERNDVARVIKYSP